MIQILFLAMMVHAGEWRRLSHNTIALEGEIVRGDFAKFQKIYRPTDTVVQLDSSGGDMDDALTIGRILSENKRLTTVVRGSCFSACANYLFLAGATRVLDHGVVGFHGNWKAMTEAPSFLEQAARVPPAVRERAMMYHWVKTREEADFMSKVGVRQELFDRTQGESDAGLYRVLLPGPRLFEKYGIHGVVGRQDFAYAKSLGLDYGFEN